MPTNLRTTRHRDARDDDDSHARTCADIEAAMRAARHVRSEGDRATAATAAPRLPASYHLHGITFEVFPRGPVAACTVDMASDEEVYGLRVDVMPPRVSRHKTTPRRAYRLDVLAGFKRGAADYCRGIVRRAEDAYRYAGTDRADVWAAKRLGYALAQAEGEADTNGRASPVIVGTCSRDYGLNLPAIFLETSRKVNPPARRRRGAVLRGTSIRQASTDHGAGR